MFEFSVSRPAEPITHAWQSAKQILSDPSEASRSFKSKFVSRAEFSECGANICREKFRNYFVEDFYTEDV
jgi:actin-related protein